MAKNETKETLEAREQEKKAREMVEEIARNIAMLARQVSAILDGRLKKQSIIILLANTTRLPQYQIETVLDAIANMEKNHLK